MNTWYEYLYPSLDNPFLLILFCMNKSKAILHLDLSVSSDHFFLDRKIAELMNWKKKKIRDLKLNNRHLFKIKKLSIYHYKFGTTVLIWARISNLVVNEA